MEPKNHKEDRTLQNTILGSNTSFYGGILGVEVQFILHFYRANLALAYLPHIA